MISKELSTIAIWGIGLTTALMGLSYHIESIADSQMTGISRTTTSGSLTVQLSFAQSFGAGGVFLVVAFGAWWLELSLARELIVSYLRSAVQLICLGFILTPIFVSNSLIVVLTVLVVMATIAAYEVCCFFRFSSIPCQT